VSMIIGMRTVMLIMRIDDSDSLRLQACSLVDCSFFVFSISICHWQCTYVTHFDFDDLMRKLQYLTILSF